MEFYRDSLVFKNTYNYEPKNNEKIENNEPKEKTYFWLKAAIIALIMTLGPTVGRKICNEVESYNKKYELEEKDKMYDVVVEHMKNLRVTNSIMATKYISNLINDKYLTIDNNVDEIYNITDEADLDTIIGNPSDKSNSEMIAKILNETFDDIDAYSVEVGYKMKYSEDANNISNEYMCLVIDKKIGINYLYWTSLDKFINFDDLKGFNTDLIAGNINILSEYVTGKLNPVNLYKLISNSNSYFYNINFEIYKDKGNDLYNATSYLLVDLNKKITNNKVNIEYKVLTKKVPE